MTRERQQKPDLNLQRRPDPTRPQSQRANNAPNQTPRLPPLRAPTPAQLELIQQRRETELRALAHAEAKRQLEVTKRERATRIQGKLETRRVVGNVIPPALDERRQARGEPQIIALEGATRADEITGEPNAQLPAEERQARLEAQQAAFAVWQQLEQQKKARARTDSEREQRVNQANRQAVAFGTGQASSVNGLGSVISALPVEERLEVFEGIRDQHPATWAKLETLPLVRWDEEWQARVAEQRAQLGGSRDAALLEVTAVESQTFEAPVTDTRATGEKTVSDQLPVEQSNTNSSASAAERLKRLYELTRRGGLDATQLREYTELTNWLIKGGRLLEALDGLQADFPNLNRSVVLETLLNSVYLAGLRNTITVQALGGIEQITFDGFVEQLSGFMAYSNTLDFSDLNNPKDAKSGAAKILQDFGYKATPAIHGAWGLQMMIFTPIPGKAKYAQSILAFRGTEAVKMPVTPAVNAASSRGDPNTFRRNNESELDTATDFGDADIAYTQFDTNRSLIADAVKSATRGGSTVISGHSLGGALAQITAARFPVFQQLLTFQAPHVKAKDVDRLEAQQKLRSMNYRMNLDVVPRGGPQARMAGEIAVFEDQNNSVDTPFSNAFASHHTPMLAELLEQTRQDGGVLTPQQAALVNAGKQPPNELNDPGQDANTVRLQQLIPGAEDKTVVAQGSFSAQNMNVVANNLLVNVMRELLLPDLEKITVASIKQGGGVNVLLNRLGQTRRDINGTELISQARGRAFSSASKEILEAYGNSTAVFAMTAAQIKAELSVNTIGMATRRKLLEIALWWKTGNVTPSVFDIIQTTSLMASQDLGRWWYSVNLDGEDLYRGLVEQSQKLKLDPPYL